MKDDRNCHVEPIRKQPGWGEMAQQSRILLSVRGMGCVNCANRVQNSIVSLNGVIEAEVDHMRGFAKVRYNPDMATIDDILRAVAQAGGDGRHEYMAIALS